MIYYVIYSLLVLIGLFQQTVVRVYYILNTEEKEIVTEAFCSAIELGKFRL